jgi:hypothetical protein
MDPDPGGPKTCGSGMEIGSKMEKFGSGINIPDPQHWLPFFSN